MAVTESWKKEVTSFSAMAAIEVVNVILLTLYKAAAVKGLSNMVLIPYANFIGALAFSPLLFFFPRPQLPSLFSFPIIARFLLLSFFWYGGSVCSYQGVYYTSPTIAFCIANLLPVFTFVFALIFRMESLNFGSAKTRAKIIGTIISVSGALVTVLYKGPVILSSESSSSLSLEQNSNANWLLGCGFLIGLCTFCSLSLIIQTQIIKLYPSELVVGVTIPVFTAIIAAISGAIFEPNINAWALRTDMALMTVLLTGIFGSSLVAVVHTWSLNKKGPLYVSIFKPFSIVIAAVMGVTFLGDTLYIGSVIGATIILIGFYAVTWAKTEDIEQRRSDGKTPLLLT